MVSTNGGQKKIHHDIIGVPGKGLPGMLYARMIPQTSTFRETRDRASHRLPQDHAHSFFQKYRRCITVIALTQHLGFPALLVLKGRIWSSRCMPMRSSCESSARQSGHLVSIVREVRENHSYFRSLIASLFYARIIGRRYPLHSEYFE